MKAGAALANFISEAAARVAAPAGRGCVVLTGAGCSTESGIPDYRGPKGRYRHKDFAPLTYQKFMREDSEKKRYWARSMLGYSILSGASCNAVHLSIHALSRAHVVRHILTQNVDGLHHLAAYGGHGDASDDGAYKYITSSAPLTEVHGNIHRAICVQCKYTCSRVALQRLFEARNPEIFATYGTDTSNFRADGDFNAPPEAVEAMQLVMCPECGGYFKPHVVLFGENVGKDVVDATSAMVREGATCLVCVGTSMQVYSAYRYALMAKEAGVPVCVVNAGVTRADSVADLKLDVESAGEVLTHATRELLGQPEPALDAK